MGPPLFLPWKGPMEGFGCGLPLALCLFGHKTTGLGLSWSDGASLIFQAGLETSLSLSISVSQLHCLTPWSSPPQFAAFHSIAIGHFCSGAFCTCAISHSWRWLWWWGRVALSHLILRECIVQDNPAWGPLYPPLLPYSSWKQCRILPEPQIPSSRTE